MTSNDGRRRARHRLARALRPKGSPLDAPPQDVGDSRGRGCPGRAGGPGDRAHRSSEANRDLAAKNLELADANNRTEKRFELARDAIRAFQESVTEDEMLKNKELERLRNKLLRSASGFYEKLEKILQDRADRKSQETLAESYESLGS